MQINPQASCCTVDYTSDKVPQSKDQNQKKKRNADDNMLTGNSGDVENGYHHDIIILKMIILFSYTIKYWLY